MPARAACPIGFAPGPSMCARLRGRSGLDHGPISVHDKMAAMGLEAPSPAWLARIFRQEGVARAEPSKRPRAAWRRFDLPRPQRLPAARRHRVRPGRRAQGGDLAGSRTTTGAWRWPGWSPRAMASQAAIDVFDKGAAARGAHPAPARPTTARPSTPAGAESPAAWWSTCAPWASNPPPADPTGPPPTGDNERFHQTLLRYLDRQPLADSIAEPPGDGSTASTTPCNTQRPHQGLPGRITPQQAWDATEVARAPRPGHGTDPITPADRTRARRARRAPTAAPAQAHRPQRRARSRPSPATGADHIGGIAFLVRRALAGHRTTAIWDATTITFADVHGEVLIQYNWPPEGVTRVSHHPPDPTNQRGGRGRRRPQPSPKS